MTSLNSMPANRGSNPVSIIRLPVRTRTAAEADRINAVRADIKAHNELHAQLQAEAQATTWRSGFTKETNAVYMANMSTLSYKSIQTQITGVENLIKRGIADNDFHASNGNTTAESAEQYLSWLQTRAEELQSGANGSSIDIEAWDGNSPLRWKFWRTAISFPAPSTSNSTCRKPYQVDDFVGVCNVAEDASSEQIGTTTHWMRNEWGHSETRPRTRSNPGFSVGKCPCSFVRYPLGPNLPSYLFFCSSFDRLAYSRSNVSVSCVHTSNRYLHPSKDKESKCNSIPAKSARWSGP